MNRRQLLKSLSLFTGLAALTPKNIFASNDTRELHFIGIGDGGCKMVNYILNNGEEADFTFINSSFKGNNIPVGNQVIYQLPVDAYNSRNINLAVLQSQKGLPQNIETVFADNTKRFVVFAGLGGYTGSYLSKEICDYLNKKKVEYNSIITLPFSFEGKIKRQQAETMRSSFSNFTQNNFFDFDKIRKKHGNFKMVDAFDLANQYEFDFTKEKV